MYTYRVYRQRNYAQEVFWPAGQTLTRAGYEEAAQAVAEKYGPGRVLLLNTGPEGGIAVFDIEEVASFKITRVIDT